MLSHRWRSPLCQVVDGSDPLITLKLETGSFLVELWTVVTDLRQKDVLAAINSLSIEWPVKLQLLAFELREKLLQRSQGEHLHCFAIRTHLGGVTLVTEAGGQVGRDSGE